jgi:predicted nucleic acid-binding protein
MPPAPRPRNCLYLGPFRLRDQLGVEEVAIDHGAVLDLASETGLTAYDASYLWLARQLKAELVTLERQLASAEAMTRL